MAKWQWALRTGFKDYTRDENELLEKAFNEGKTIVKVNDSYEADLKKMIQYQISDSTRSRKIQRVVDGVVDSTRVGSKRGASSSDSGDGSSPPKAPKLGAPGHDVSRYYNTDVAGVSDISHMAHGHDHIMYDRFDNPMGSAFDLGRDGAFVGFTVLIGQFYSFPFENPRDELEKKGFRVIHTTKETDFLRKLPEASVAWVISGSMIAANAPDFADRIVSFHESGKGLYLWADNQPYLAHANAILSKLGRNLELTGDTPGSKTLKLGLSARKGEFGTHMITTAIEHLFEGVTICHPKKESAFGDSFDLVATSTDGHPVILASSPGIRGGRVVVDCAFTKLYINWDTAGTARYVCNSTVWLTNVEAFG